MSTLLTIAEVAERLKISTSTMYKWVEKKKITFIKLPGGDIRFDEDTLQGWLDRKTVKAQKQIA